MSSSALSPFYQSERCRQRNRQAALRHGLQTVTLKFLSAPELSVYDTENLSVQGYIQNYAPRTEAERALKASLPTDTVLYIHYMEAANDNFIGDRFMFLGKSTLKNIADDANAGFAFMNSHRTGGLSHPAELPFGKTFWGAYQSKEGRKTAQVGVYMVGGLKPNGESGPTTDDFHTMIETGILSDVSVGLYEGWMQCDVCGNDLYGYDEETNRSLCPHYPGLTYKMTKEEIAKQKDRGIPGGCATCTYHDARCGEVSGVFDGAVPGAGFRKLALARRRGAIFSAEHRREIQATYGSLLKKGEFEMDENEQVEGIVSSVLRRLGLGPRRLSTLHEDAHDSQFAATHFLGGAADEQRQAEMTAQLEAQAAQIEELKKASARSAVQQYVNQGRIKPAQLEAATTLYLSHPDQFAAFVGELSPVQAFAGDQLLNAESLADTQANTSGKRLISPAECYAFRRDMNLKGGRL